MLVLFSIILALFLGYRVLKHKTEPMALILIVVHIFISFTTYIISTTSLTTDTEVWSGVVQQVEHTEEWDEVIPAHYESRTSFDSEGNTKTKQVFVPEEKIHHYATNRIKTSDNGWITVKNYQDRYFDDSYPNTNQELAEFWTIGEPSASVHKYKNKVQASNSLYNSRGIDLTGYTDLPEYPSYVENYTKINRLVGKFPNFKAARELLDKRNSELNIMKKTSEIEKLENRDILEMGEEDKLRSWKQVNIILVNLQDKPYEWGFALQDYWENGNKNDYIIAMSLNTKNVVEWVHPFSWTEVEYLNTQVISYLNKRTITDTTEVVQEVSDLIQEHFIRKEFKDFEYLEVEIPQWVYVLSFLSMIVCMICPLVIRDLKC